LEPVALEVKLITRPAVHHQLVGNRQQQVVVTQNTTQHGGWDTLVVPVVAQVVEVITLGVAAHRVRVTPVALILEILMAQLPVVAVAVKEGLEALARNPHQAVQGAQALTGSHWAQPTLGVVAAALMDQERQALARAGVVAEDMAKARLEPLVLPIRAVVEVVTGQPLRVKAGVRAV
jgi:hypothetical protein